MRTSEQRQCVRQHASHRQKPELHAVLALTTILSSDQLRYSIRLTDTSLLAPCYSSAERPNPPWQPPAASSAQQAATLLLTPRLLLSQSAPTARPNVAAIDHDRILQAAARFLTQVANSTHYTSVSSQPRHATRLLLRGRRLLARPVKPHRPLRHSRAALPTRTPSSLIVMRC